LIFSPPITSRYAVDYASAAIDIVFVFIEIFFSHAEYYALFSQMMTPPF